MIDSKRITKQQLDEIELLSMKIDNNSMDIEDYKRYEELLLFAGMKQSDIREKMNKYNYSSYEEYLRAKKNPRNKEEEKIVNIKIVSGLVVLFAVLLFFMAKQNAQQSKTNQNL
jgi:hypothetical protein